MMRAAAALVLALTPFSSAGGPTLHLSQSTATLGTYEIVSGAGWAPGVEVQLEVCGIGASSGDCDLQDAVLATAGAAGTFTAHLQVNEPPTPCPCTVHAAPFSGPASTPADVPIAIPGLRYLPQAAHTVAGKASVLDITVTPDSSPLAQLGAEGSAEVTVTFGNLSQGPAADPSAALTLTRGGRTVGRYPLTWGKTPLPIGQTRQLVYDVPLPGGWFRDYGIGVALGSAAPVRTVGVAVRPWGELAAPFALVAGIGLILLGRKRRHGDVAAEDDETTAIDELMTGADRTQAPEMGSDPGPEPDSELVRGPAEPESALAVAAALAVHPAAPELEREAGLAAETESDPEPELAVQPEPAAAVAPRMHSEPEPGVQSEPTPAVAPHAGPEAGPSPQREPTWEVMAMRRTVPPPEPADERRSEPAREYQDPWTKPAQRPLPPEPD